jgi:hypothetical protein
MRASAAGTARNRPHAVTGVVLAAQESLALCCVVPKGGTLSRFSASRECRKDLGLLTEVTFMLGRGNLMIVAQKVQEAVGQ